MSSFTLCTTVCLSVVMESYKLQLLRSANILLSYRSDHSITSLLCCFVDVVHGKGLWICNNSLLHDIDYLKCINIKIGEVKTILHTCL